MADDDQQQRYWFPYWTSPPAPAPAPRPAIRPQLSRRDTRSAPPQPSPVTPSPSRRQPQPAQAAATAAPRAAGGGAGPPQAQSQPTRLSTRTAPPRGHPLSPVREPDSTAAPASATIEAKPPVKPATPPQRAAHEEVPKELDIIIPQEKIIREPPSDTKTQNKAVGKEKEKEKDKEKDKEKKDKDRKEKKNEKEQKEKKDKEKEHKEKEEKEKEHKEKEKEKEYKEKKDKDKYKEEHVESKVHSGKLHKELKAGVADMVHKLGAASVAPSADRHASGGGTTVITLAGDNKGASMKVSDHAETESKDAANKERRARKLDDGKQEARGAGKGMTAFVNSNVQVVNNSLVLHSSCSSSDPGVHLKLSTKSKKKGDSEDAGGKGGAAAAAKKK